MGSKTRVWLVGAAFIAFQWTAAIHAQTSTSVPVRAPKPVLASITVTPTSPLVAVGLTVQFTATGIYSDGSTQILTTTVAWSSTATAIATINAKGLATGVAQGSTTIQAVSGSIAASTTLNVNAPALTSITVTAALLQG